MAIKLVREFKQSQQLSITPQLKKSIDLLQLSRLEIINKINNEIEENPFLQKDFDNESIILNIDTGKYFGINNIGKRIISLIEQREQSIQTLITELKKQYHNKEYITFYFFNYYEFWQTERIRY